jgi:hypothetical protein
MTSRDLEDLLDSPVSRTWVHRHTTTNRSGGRNAPRRATRNKCGTKLRVMISRPRLQRYVVEAQLKMGDANPRWLEALADLLPQAWTRSRAWPTRGRLWP